MRHILNLLYRIGKKRGGEIKKILFFRPDNKVGDSIIDTFFVRELKKIFPSAEITLLMISPYEVIFKNNPYVSKIITLPQKNKWLNALTKLPALRREKFDLIIDIPWGGTLKRILYIYLIGAARVMSAQIKGYNFVTDPVGWSPAGHITGGFADALNKLGAREVNTDYELCLTRREEQAADDFLKENDISCGNILIINPKASAEERSMSVQKLAQIVAEIKTRMPFLKIIVLDHTGGYAAVKNEALIYNGRNIRLSAALVAKADIVLSVDTGIVHIADVFNKNIVILYSETYYKKGPTVPDAVLWGSKNPRNILLKGRSVNDIEIKLILKALMTEKSV